MPETDSLHQVGSSFGLNRRRDHHHHLLLQSMESPGHENELDAFQKHILDRFQDLASSDSDQLLSISWVHKLLDAFLCSLEEFKIILFNNKVHLGRPPMDRYVSDFFERCVKALDVCNAIRDGIDQIRQWQKLLEIVVCSLDNNNQRTAGEGPFRRAKKALVDLAISMLVEEKESSSGGTQRNRSFGRHATQRGEPKSFSQFRSFSWSVSRSWSAAKQLQAISSNIAVPKANEVASTGGLNVAVFTMNHVLLFAMWALVAAIPCQDRGLHMHLSIPRHFIWAAPFLALHERIVEESKKRGGRRNNNCGLLKEIHDMERCARNMNEATDFVQFPLNEDKGRELKQAVGELRAVHEAVKIGLDPLERQIRDVFRRIVRSRVEGLDT
ncbi:hypothetical protein M569_03877, partial [Genlisea aurea]